MAKRIIRKLKKLKKKSADARKGPVVRATVYGKRKSNKRVEGLDFIFVLALPGCPKQKVAGKTTPTGCIFGIGKPVFCEECRLRWVCPYSLVLGKFYSGRSTGHGTGPNLAGKVTVVKEEDVRMGTKKKLKKKAKAKKTLKSKGKSKGTIVGLVREIFTRWPECETDKVIERVKKKFPASKVNAQHVGYYRAKMRDEGILP